IAHSLVDLVGLELGMVLLRQDDSWTVAARHAVSDQINLRYSRTLVQYVVEERRTFFQDPEKLATQVQSLQDIAAAVVSPIFGLQEDVVGVLYGTRTWHGRKQDEILPIEAQIVQLLAVTVGAQLARDAATRTRVQFEQFFSPELVRELERN